MSILISGIILFFGMHLVPGLTGFRDKLITSLGEMTYQGLFAAVSLLGFVLIVYGKSKAHFTPVWDPPLWTSHLSAVIMLFAFIFLAAVYLKSNIRRFTPHPMLWGVILWALAHLISNGDLASILLFGSFGIYSVFDIYSANRRGASRQLATYPVTNDVIMIFAGLVGYGLLIYLHRYLFGLPAF